MDYANNSTGRSIVDNKTYPSYPNGMMYLAAIETDILSSLEGGSMYIFVGDDIGEKSYLVPTNSNGLY